jgi:hypothetical protein
MAQTYAQFKTFIRDMLWRPNDQVLADNLDQIIKMANSELRSMTSDWQRRQQSKTIAPTSGDFNLTVKVPDLESVLSVTNNINRGYYSRNNAKTWQQVVPSRIYELRAQHPDQTLPYYSVDRDDWAVYLRFAANFSADNPGDLQLFYRVGIPDYATTDSSWIEDEYKDLYMYAVLKHAAIFVREEDRVGLFNDLMTSAFNVADMDDKHNKAFGGSPLYMSPHHRVP